MTTTAPAPPRLAPALRELGRPYRRRLVAVATGVLIAALLDLVGPFVVRHLIDDNLTPHRTQGLGALAAIYLAAVAAGQVITASYGYLAATVAQRALAALRTRLFAHLLALPTSYHDRTPTGDAIARATADVETIDDLFTSTVVTLLGESVRLATVTIAMLVLSPPLTGIAALSVPPLIVITSLLRRRIRDAERATRTAVGATTEAITENVTGADIIRAYARQRVFTDRFTDTLRRWLTASNTSTRYNAVYAPALAVLSTTMTAALLWAGGRGTAHAIGVSIGTLTAFVLLFTRFFTPLINLGDEWQSVQAALAGAERVYTILAVPAHTTATRGGHGRPSWLSTVGASRDPVIRVREVEFGYHPGHPVLDGITLTVHKGQHVAMVGRTGAGKTSIVALIAGLYRPWSGQILLDGHDPADLTDTQRQRLLGYVPQTAHLFTGTVIDNLTYGDPAISHDDLMHATTITGADRFITTLPERYHTRIGTGDGVRLSAGQRQLLALTRALATRPRVLLLDEATAVVDPASDAAFRAALRQHVQPAGTAVLTIAHRLATARDADHVLVIDHGRIIESGPPHQLLASDGHFAALTAMEDSGWDWRQDA